MFRLRFRGGLQAALTFVVLASSPLHAEEAPSDQVPPKLIHRVDAIFPEEAALAGLSGVVLLQVTVDANGLVKEATVTHSAGHSFDEAAIAAAKQLRFEAATFKGTPVPALINYEITFAPPPLPTLKETATPAPIAPPFESRIQGERSFSTASASTVRDQDFLARPRSTPEDILRVVPGLVLAQHQGGGKADQIFLRGFDADHGTDVAVSLDGIPINMPSHAHGQGYTDLHFLIPEVIERIEVSKGPYFADKGDFDTAGAANLVTRDTLERSEVIAEGGSFGTARLVGLASMNLGPLHPWFAGELYRTDGPFVHAENLYRYNLFTKVGGDVAPGAHISLFASAYASNWTGSGQIPQRLVDSGFLDRFGALDPSEGGDTQRQQLTLAFRGRNDEQSHFSATISAINYGLTLFNNFTFQTRDPVHGDEIEQTDQRLTLAADIRYDRTTRDVLPGSLTSSFGTQLRFDNVAATLRHVERRARLNDCFVDGSGDPLPAPCVDTVDRQTNAALWLQEDWRPLRGFRLVAGLRGDLFEWDVRSQRPDGGLDPEHPTSIPPAVQQFILSPKLSAVISPVEPLDLFLNFGSGFHSNDARSVVEARGVGALPRALGGEAGTRVKLLDGKLNLAAVFWLLHLDSEQVWSGDNGGTEASDATFRLGVDFEGRWSILPWLYFDMDVSWARSRYTVNAGNGAAVALAPPLTVTGGLSAKHPSGFGGSIRLRAISDRPGNQFTPQDGVPPCTPESSEDDRCYLTAQGYAVLDAQLTYTAANWSVAIIAENLTNAAYREAQFGDAARIVSPPDGRTVSSKGVGWTPETHAVPDLYFTPGNPIGARVQLAYRF